MGPAIFPDSRAFGKIQPVAVVYDRRFKKVRHPQQRGLSARLEGFVTIPVPLNIQRANS
jgi:hypothetical protein